MTLCTTMAISLLSISWTDQLIKKGKVKGVWRTECGKQTNCPGVFLIIVAKYVTSLIRKLIGLEYEWIWGKTINLLGCQQVCHGVHGQERVCFESNTEKCWGWRIAFSLGGRRRRETTRRKSRRRKRVEKGLQSKRMLNFASVWPCLFVSPMVSCGQKGWAMVSLFFILCSLSSPSLSACFAYRTVSQVDWWLHEECPPGNSWFWQWLSTRPVFPFFFTVQCCLSSLSEWVPCVYFTRLLPWPEPRT